MIIFLISLRSKWKHYEIQPKENGPKPKHRSFVPAVEFIAYSLENWDEILGEMVSDETGRWCRKPTGEASMACWKVLRLLGLISCCSIGKMCQTACFKHSAGVFRYILYSWRVWGFARYWGVDSSSSGANTNYDQSYPMHLGIQIILRHPSRCIFMETTACPRTPTSARSVMHCSCIPAI